MEAAARRAPGRRAGRGPGELERGARHRSGVDLARKGFPRWGEGGGGVAAGAGAGPSAAPPLVAPPLPPLCAPRAGAARARGEGYAAGRALKK